MYTNCCINLCINMWFSIAGWKSRVFGSCDSQAPMQGECYLGIIALGSLGRLPGRLAMKRLRWMFGCWKWWKWWELTQPADFSWTFFVFSSHWSTGVCFFVGFRFLFSAFFRYMFQDVSRFTARHIPGELARHHHGATKDILHHVLVIHAHYPH